MISNNWEIIGIASPTGFTCDINKLREELITHPNLRLRYITGD